MTVVHATVNIEQVFAVPVERTFQAWADSVALRRWYLPGDDGWSSEIVEHEFSVGGIKKLTFGPEGETHYTEDCRYEDIVQDQRIVYTMSIANGLVRLTASLVTIELSGNGSTTKLLMIDQMAILDGGDTAEDRKKGWGEVFGKLAQELS